MAHAVSGKIDPVGGVKNAANAAFGIGNPVDTAATNVMRQYDENTAADNANTMKPRTVGTDFANRQFKEHGDTNEAAALQGVHPLEQAFQATGPRHPMGRGVPKGSQ